jgi:hypothetical protein
MAFRGSGGYKELRIQLHEHIANHATGEIAAVSNEALQIIKN